MSDSPPVKWESLISSAEDIIDLMARRLGYTCQKYLPAGTHVMLLAKGDKFIYGEVAVPDGAWLEWKCDTQLH